LRFAGVRASPRRVRRVMRENGLLAPHRVGRTEAKPHDRTIITTTKPGSSPGTAIVPQPKCEPINAGLIRTQ
jgi:hypothetical protein